jgi:hypothetical protein
MSRCTPNAAGPFLVGRGHCPEVVMRVAIVVSGFLLMVGCGSSPNEPTEPAEPTRLEDFSSRELAVDPGLSRP